MATHLSAIGRASVNLAVLFERGVGFLASLVRSVVPIGLCIHREHFMLQPCLPHSCFLVQDMGKHLVGTTWGFLRHLCFHGGPVGGIANQLNSMNGFLAFATVFTSIRDRIVELEVLKENV